MNYRIFHMLLVSAALGCSAGCASNSQKQPPISQTPLNQPGPAVAETDSTKVSFPLQGTWAGELKVPGHPLTILYHLQRSPEAPGEWLATMDSPDQGAKGIPVSKVIFKDGHLQLEVALASGLYEGTFTEDGTTIVGSWSQGGQSFPLNLKRARTQQATGPVRPQHPKPPYRYTIEDVEFAGGPPTAGSDEFVTLSGTLTLPDIPGPLPVLVLLTGSGPQDRDETIMGHKPFWVLADFLTLNNIAVLRIDDRGVGKSTGVFKGATISDFASDAVAAVDYLSNRDDINPDAIGLLGHSEGANVAPLAALASDKINFLILLAPTAVPGTELLARQNARLFKGNGMSPEGAAAYEKNMLNILKKIVATPLDQPISKDLRDEIRSDFNAAAKAMSPADRKLYAPQNAAQFEKILDSMVAQLTSNGMRSFLSMTPAETFSKIQLPTLAVYGSKDWQVSPDQNKGPLAKQLAGNSKATVTVLDDLNHLFQPAKTGDPREYSHIETTLDADLLNTILDWLGNHGWAQPELED